MERFNCYGGRGITVCPKWQESFEAFLNDVGFAPSPKHTLGRINNDGNYEPNNVEWQTMKQQSRNSRHNRLLTFEGETLTIGDWAIRTGINRQTIQARIDARGWSVEKALSKVPHRL